MGIKLYKDDKECDADADQVSIMTEAGWSTKKPEPSEVKKEPAKTTTVKTGS